MKTFYALSCIVSAARMACGATTALYLLEQGVSLADLATIKIVQAIVLIIFEIPTGLFADRLGRKWSILISTACGLASFGMYYSGQDLIQFCIAEAFNALTLSFWSGAFDALVVDSLPEYRSKGHRLDSLFSSMGSSTSLFAAFGGFFGGWLGRGHLTWPFVLSASLMAIGSLIILILIREPKKHSQLSRIGPQLKPLIQSCLFNPVLRPYFLLQTLIQFSCQPLLHYWQPYFKILGPNLESDFTGSVFLCYVLAQSAVSGFVAVKLRNGIWNPVTVMILQSILAATGLIVMSLSSSLILGVMAFILVQGCGANFRQLLNSDLNSIIPDTNRALVLSGVSLVSRFGMIIGLLACQALSGLTSIQSLFGVAGLSMGAIGWFLISWKRSKSESYYFTTT